MCACHPSYHRKPKIERSQANCWWLTPIILDTQEIEIRRIVVEASLRAPISKNPITKKKKKELVEWLKV
jgi:hypothetical protein